MVRKNAFLLVLSSLFFTANVCNAELISYTSGLEKVVHDTINDQYWIWDMTPLTNMTYDEQLAAIDELYNSPSYYGYTNWHMATIGEFTQSFVLTHQGTGPMLAFRPTGALVGRMNTWVGRLNELEFNHLVWVWSSSLVDMGWGLDWQGWAEACNPLWQEQYLAAFVTSNTPVPEPATSLLLAVGIAGMAVFRKKVKKS